MQKQNPSAAIQASSSRENQNRDTVRDSERHVGANPIVPTLAQAVELDRLFGMWDKL